MRIYRVYLILILVFILSTIATTPVLAGWLTSPAGT